MTNNNANDLLHGAKLETIVEMLVEDYGWKSLASHIDIKCFKERPSIKSSLKFLRKTPWARVKIEQLYLSTISQNNPWAQAIKKSKS